MDYLWIVVAGGISAFVASMGIGANDVGNAFATSIGSKALTIKSAVIIASVFECAGAILMGSHVTKTIRKDIADYECFKDDPEIFIYGCFCVMCSVSLWLLAASYLEMPVSTTHSCVGGMIGMTLVTGGSDCVIWYKPVDTFPWLGGVSGIILSWFLSPFLSATISSSIFYLTRLSVLRKENSFDKTYWSIPIFISLTITLNSFFIIYKGGKGIGLDDLSGGIALLISLSLGSLVGLSIVPFIPKMKQRIHNKFNEPDEPDEHDESDEPDESDESDEPDEPDDLVDNEPINDNQDNHKKNKSCKCINHVKENINYDVNKIKVGKVKEIHDDAEVFDPKTEESFKYLQIFTAICGSFSHGANDVANAVGPYAAIVSIYMNDGEMSQEVTMDSYGYAILSLGGIGISLGLLLYGYKIIKAIGVKLCCITPSRGFAIELGSASIVIIGSRFGIPLSTTHCQVGATIGVAALEDTKKCSGINWSVVSRVCFGWIITLIVVGGTTSVLVLQGINAPSYNNDCYLNTTT